jgi:hypothetical protein
MDPVHQISAILKCILAVIFGGMSVLFYFVNRAEDKQRMKKLKELDLAEAAHPIDETKLPPRERVQRNFSKLYTLNGNPLARGKLLEDVFNQIFALGEISIGCPFERRRDENGTPTEQVDGVIELDSSLYLVEVRWEELPIGLTDIQKHLELLSSGDEASPTKGIIISFASFTEQAIDAAKQAYRDGHLLVLCTIGDFAQTVEGEGHFDALLRTRIHIATVGKNPFATYTLDE